MTVVSPFFRDNSLSLISPRQSKEHCPTEITKLCLLNFNVIEQFSIECRKTKTKTNVITVTNHDRRRQSNEPIRTRSKYT